MIRTLEWTCTICSIFIAFHLLPHPARRASRQEGEDAAKEKSSVRYLPDGRCSPTAPALMLGNG